MHYVITWDGPVEDVSVQVSGQASLPVLRTLMHEAVTDSRWSPAMRVLFDQRELNESELDADDMRQRVDLVIGARERLGRPHIAMVVSGPAGYGLQRMADGLSDNWRQGDVIDVDIFYTVEDARAWLSSFPPPVAR